jgi:hypothetical protein
MFRKANKYESARFGFDKPHIQDEDDIRSLWISRRTIMVAGSTAWVLGLTACDPTDILSTQKNATATLKETPSSAEKWKSVTYILWYMPPGLDPGVVPTVSLVGAPVWVTITSQKYDPATW